MSNLITPVFGTSVSDQLLMLLDASEQDRIKKFQDAWNAYHGDAPKPLKVREGDPDDNVDVPYEQVIVNKGRAFLFGGDGVTFQVEGANARGEQPEADGGRRKPPEDSDQQPNSQAAKAQSWLDACWVRNRKNTTLLKLATNGGVCGQAFIKMNVKPGQEFPRLIVLDPTTVAVDVDDEDIDGDPYAYIITWNGIDRDSDKPEAIARRQRIERRDDGSGWDIIDQRAKLTGGQRGGQVGWTDIGTTFWPHSWPPIIDCQNLPMPNEYWGVSDIEAAVQRLVLAIRRALSNINRIIRLHAHPKIMGVGLTPEQVEDLDWDPDSIVPLPPGTEISSLEMQSDLRSSLDFYKRLKELLHQVSDLPEVATGKMEDVGQLSGNALGILYGPIKERTETKHNTYGDLLSELNRRLLEWAGFGPEVTVLNNWPEIVPNDPVAEGEALTQDKTFGVSDRTLQEKRGYDPDEEAERAEEEHQVNIKRQQELFAVTQPKEGDTADPKDTGNDSDSDN